MKQVKQLPVPEPFRAMYKACASRVYTDAAMDLPELENRRKYSRKSVIEIIRDANRIRSYAEQDLAREKGYIRRKGSQPGKQVLVDENTAFVEWIKVNEYNEAFSRDMDKAVEEMMFGK